MYCNEYFSFKQAPEVVQTIWKLANDLGYTQFENRMGNAVIDDHYFLYKYAKLQITVQTHIQNKNYSKALVALNNFLPSAVQFRDKVINFMGQEVNENYKGMVLEIYQDGTYVKKNYE